MLEVDPPGFRIAATCSCEKHHLHLVFERGQIRVDWMPGWKDKKDASVVVIRDVRYCLRCATPLFVEDIRDRKAAGG